MAYLLDHDPLSSASQRVVVELTGEVHSKGMTTPTGGS
jgi:hypothetical protein